MQFTHTINQYTLKEYFFVDGKRVSKSRYDSVRRGKPTELFLDGKWREVPAAVFGIVREMI